MTKREFLDKLGKKLAGLPQSDAEERLNFYGEMIDDRMEEGLSEEDAVAGVGDVDDIASQIVADTPLTKIVKEKIKPKRALKAWEIIFLALGSPIWLSLIIAALAVIFSIYVVIWSVILSLWAVDVSFAACVLGGLVGAGIFAIDGHIFMCVAAIGAAVMFAGLAIFMFLGCAAATRGAAYLTRKIAVGIKNLFIKGDKE